MATPARLALEATIAALLDAQDFRAAALAVANYEARQPSPRGIGIDWTRYDATRDVAQLRTIFGPPPGILRGVSTESLPLLRRAAGMLLLLGQRAVRRAWLPRTTDTGLRYSPDTAALMFLFAARHRAQLAEYDKFPLAFQAFRVSVVGDARSCAACCALTSLRFTRETLPELPHVECTSDMGCRCVPVPAGDA